MIPDKLSAKESSVDNLRRLQEEDYVPKALKDQLDYALKDAESKIAVLEESNYTLDKLINEKSATLIHLEEQFKEKEEQYNFLIAEYK